MTRRSALTVAGGVIAAIAAGALAVVVNLGVLRASETTSGPGKLRATEPIVRTITDTVTIHRKGRSQPSHLGATLTPQATQGSPANDDAIKQESSDDGQYGVQENEGPEHEYGEDDDD